MRRAVMALSAVVALGGCNPFGWFGDDSSGPKPAELPALAKAQAVRVLWSASVGSAESFVFAPALVGNDLYAAARDGTVTGLEAATGRARWRVRLEHRLSAGVGTDGALVVVANDEGAVYALDAQSGKERWSARVSSEVLAAPAVGAGLVLVRSGDSRIFALGADDGKRRWVYQRAASPLVVRSPAGVTIQGDTAYAGFSGGKMVAIALSNGGVRWEATVASPRGTTELERVTDVIGDPIVQGREVCAASYQGRVACYETASGTQLWSREMSSLAGVSLDARYAYLSDERGAVHALDRTNGRSVWKQDRLAYRRLSLPLPLGAEIAVADLQGYVHFLSRDSGAFVARIATDGSPVRAAPLRLPVGFVVQTSNGGLYALAL